MEQALIAPSLIVYRHPLDSAKRAVLFEKPQPNELLIDYVERLRVPAVDGRPALHINGKAIANSETRNYRLSASDLIEVRPSMRGDFDIISLIAVVALAVAAPALSGALIEKFALEGLTAGLLRGAVALGGLLVSSLFAPAAAQPSIRQQGDEQRSYSISAARNATRLWQPFMLVLGEHRVQPDNAATPITEYIGDEQFITQAFHYGVGKLEISDRRIGTVSVANYADVSVEQSDATSGALQAYPSDVVSLAGAELEHNERVVRTLPEASTELALDFTGSLYNLAKSGIRGASVEIAVDLSPTGKNQWTRLASITINNANTKPIRQTNRYALSDAVEQYDVGVTKLTADKDSAGSFGETNTLEFSQVKAFQADNASYVGQVRDAVRIRATGQLSGQLDTYNALCRQIIPYYDSDASAWVEQPNAWDARMQNPAAIFRAYVKGFYAPNNARIAGIGLPDALLGDYSDWAEFCEDNELTCNYIITDSSHNDVLDVVARCGRALWDWHGGKLSVVWDEKDKAPAMLISPANIIEGSHTIEWIGSHDLSEQIVGRWIDPDNEWQHATLRVPNTATGAIGRQANIELAGTTTFTQATKEMNLQWAANRLLRRRQTWQMGMEAMLLRRGDIVFISMPRVDTSGDVLAYDDATRTLTLSRHVDFGGLLEAKFVLFDRQGKTTTINIKPTSDADAVCIKGARYHRTFRQAFYSNNAWQIAGVRFHFERQTRPARLKIESIAWQGERQAQITAVDHLVEYYDAETDIAVVEQAVKKFQPPQILDAQVNQGWRWRQGVYERLLSLAFNVSGNYRSAVVYAGTPLEQVARLDNTTRASWSVAASESGGYPITIVPGELGLTIGNPYSLSVRLSDNNIYPDDVTGLSVEQDIAQHTVVRWQAVDDGDVLGYRIRLTIGLVGTWQTMTPLHSGLLTASPWETFNLPPGTYTFGIKAVNLAGNESSAATYYTVSLNTDAPGQAAYFSNDGLRNWPGMRDKLILDDSGALHTETSLTWNTLPNKWEDWTSFLQSPVARATYTTEAITFTTRKKVKALLSVSVSGESSSVLQYQADNKRWSAIPNNQIITAKTLKFRCVINTNSITPASLSAFQIILVNQE